MCTSFTYQQKEGKNALARTMDFTFVLKPQAILMPRRYSWVSQIDGSSHTGTYAFIGLGERREQCLFADGVNEAGLSCATLYFPGFARYEKTSKKGCTNLAPHELVLWMLSNFGSVAELCEALRHLCIVDAPNTLLNRVLPLHWIVTDKTGDCIVIEPLKEGLSVQKNSVGVMTNSPDFSWHMTNIRNYIGLSYRQQKTRELGGSTFAPFGNGSGSVGLPGDHTPPSRFIRALFGKEAMLKESTEAAALTEIFHLLSSVIVPKGSVRTEDAPDYTQYASAMFCSSSTYYFNTYNNMQLTKIDLFSENLDAEEPKVWAVSQEQQLKVIQLS